MKNFNSFVKKTFVQNIQLLTTNLIKIAVLNGNNKKTIAGK